MRKITFLLLSVLLTFGILRAQTNTFPTTGSAGVGTVAPNASSLMEMVSTTKGLLIPRMTNAQKSAIAAPATGLMIFQTDGNKGYYYYSGAAWTTIGAASTLSNLSTNTNINATLFPKFNDAIDLGSPAKKWRNIYAQGMANADSGFYIGANPALVANGSNLILGNTGNVGIGTTTPAYKLTVAGAANITGDLTIRNSNNSVPIGNYGKLALVDGSATGGNLHLDSYGSSDLYLNWISTRPVHIGSGSSNTNFLTNGNVGFGTNSPANKISVVGNADFTGNVGIGTVTPFAPLTAVSSTGSINRGIWSAQYSANNLGAIISGRRSRGTEASPIAVGANDWGAALVSQHYDGANYIQNGSIGYRITGAATAGNIPGEWYIGASNTHDVDPYTNGTVRMVIKSSGNVGIGTTVPTAKLDVAGKLKIADGTQGIGKVLTSDATGLASWQALVNTSPWTAVGNDIYYNSGNVGIGNATPSQKLDVTGNAQISGNVIADAYQTNNGTAASFGLQLGGTSSGEVIGSKRSAGGNRYGLDFYTASTNRMVITNLGNVGIGTTNPSAKLDLNPSSGSVGYHQNANGSFMIDAPSAPGGRVAVLENGNVGIGTTSPANKFSVAGDANVDGTVYIRNANTTSFGRFLHSGTNGNFHIDNFGGGDLLLNYFATTNCRIGNTLDGPVASFMNNGNVGIGTSTPNGLFELRIDQGRKPATSTWTIVSDARLKNIEGAYTKGLAEILKLNPITYHYKNVGNRKFDEKVIASQSVGFTAQEVQKVFPEAVGTDPDGYLNLNIHPILIASINAFKEQQKQIESLGSKIISKDETISKQQQQIEQLQSQVSLILQTLGTMKSAQEACCNTAKAKSINQNEIVENVEVPILEQNAPNPVSSTTVIRYKLPSTTKEAQIVITDSKGRNLKVINLNGKSIGLVTLSAGTLAPGTYFYTLITNGKKADTKEMQIIR